MSSNYDKMKIKSLASPGFVAHELGLEVKKMGRHKSILCPNHNDIHFGSCYLTDTGYHCFSCGAKGDIFDMVSVTKSIDFNEACQFLGERLGLEPQKNTQKKKKNKQTLDDDTLQFIGIAPHNRCNNYGMFVSVGCFEELPELAPNQHYEWYPDENNGYYVIYETLEKNPLQSFMVSNERAYRTMIRNHAKEMYLKWLDIEKDILNEDGPCRAYLERIIEEFGKDCLVDYIRNDIMKELEKLISCFKEQGKH